MALFTIPLGTPFLKAVAHGVLDLCQTHQISMKEVTIYVPYTRAISHLRDAFQRIAAPQKSGLPIIQALGEIETTDPQDPESAPDTCPLRLGLLTQLVQAYQDKQTQAKAPHHTSQGPPPFHLTLDLAQTLVNLLDQCAIEEVPLEGLFALVGAEFANHWQLTLDFLKMLVQEWPALRDQWQIKEPYTAHHQAMNRFIDTLKVSPPKGWIIVAGSTGTMPATARFMKAINQLPQGLVLLPGYDAEACARSLPPTHPQYNLQKLLSFLDFPNEEIPLWPLGTAISPQAKARQDLLRQAFQIDMIPQEATSPDGVCSPVPLQGALDNVAYISAPSLSEEAQTIAHIIHHMILTTPHTVTLVTPDRALVKYVLAFLHKWKIEAEDSSGIPLSQTPLGVFWQVMIQVVRTDWHPSALLAFLKHPLSGVPLPFVSKLERHLLRGNALAPGLEGLRQGLKAESPHRNFLNQGMNHLQAAFSPLMALVNQHRPLPASQWVQALQHILDYRDALTLCHPAKAEALTDEDLPFGGFPALSLEDFETLLNNRLASQHPTPPKASHARVRILGTMEARLLQTDVMILSGLNEGTWPSHGGYDPWLSRPMRAQLGLPPQERKVGLMAHDFCQAFGGHQVFLTRSTRVGGAPTLPSRFLARLNAVLPEGLVENTAWSPPGLTAETPLLAHPPVLLEPPAPCPPREVRPRRMSVTQVELWRRDPYALYARHILKLRPLEPLNQKPDMALFGTLIHRVCEAVIRATPPGTLLARDGFLNLASRIFAPYLRHTGIATFWWPRMRQIATWFVDTENARRHHYGAYVSETESFQTRTLSTPSGPFRLDARMDRIDHLPDGSREIIDYKTGALPKTEDLALGFSPQLALEGLIAQKRSLSPNLLIRLALWHLHPGAAGCSIKTGDPDPLVHEAQEGLMRMIALFDDPSMPYLAQPLPHKAPLYNDYTHLERVAEWRR